MQHLLMVDRAARSEHTPEAEPVVIETVGNVAVLVLDDGERLEFNRAELVGALSEAETTPAAA